MEADESRKEEVSFVQQKLEEHDPAWEALWRETRRWCLGEMTEIFADLGVRIERQYFESELLDRSHEVVKQLLEKGIAKESEGAVIVDPGSGEARGFGFTEDGRDFVVRRKRSSVG